MTKADFFQTLRAQTASPRGDKTVVQVRIDLEAIVDNEDGQAAWDFANQLRCVLLHPSEDKGEKE